MMDKEKCAGWGMYLIRLSLGIVFLAHGIQKLSAMDSTVMFFASLGLPAIVAYAIAVLETLSGLAMILGLYVKYAGWVIVATMFFAIILATRKMGFFGGWEYNLVLLLVALGVSCAGNTGMMCPGCGFGSCAMHKK